LQTGEQIGYSLDMLASVTHATFAEYLGERFRMYVDAERALDVELIEVVPYGSRATKPSGAGGGREPFSILFRGPATPVVPQRIYRIAHDRFGMLELFLVPIGPDAHGMRYEAVFS